MKTTISIWSYIVIIVVSLLMVLAFPILRSINDKYYFADILLGIGAGGISSAIVSLIIDVMNTKQNKKLEKEVFSRINLELYKACEDLPMEFVIAVQEATDYSYDDEKELTFTQWAEILLKDNQADDRILNEADYALQQINEISRQTSILKQSSRIYLNNSNFDEAFLKKIRRVENLCQRIERQRKRGEYEGCLDIITKEFIKAVIEYNKELSSIYEEPFNLIEE